MSSDDGLLSAPIYNNRCNGGPDGGEAVVTAVEMVTGSEGVCYRVLEMTAAMALTNVGRNGGGC